MSDPSINTFTDLIHGPDGYIQAAAGDEYQISGSFISSSTQNSLWDTHSAVLRFTAGTSTVHLTDITGSDYGPSTAGYVDNFAWDRLMVDSGQSLQLRNGKMTPGGALYVSSILFADAPADGTLASYIASHVSNLSSSDAMNIYYDPSQVANAYLNDLSYALGNGGVLAPISVPEPSIAVMSIGLSVLLLRRRRPRRQTIAA